MGEDSCDIFDQIDWPSYISKIIYPPKYGKAISKETPLSCKFWMAKCNDYLKELRSLVNDSGKRAVANYLGWRFTSFSFVELFSITLPHEGDRRHCVV